MKRQLLLICFLVTSLAFYGGPVTRQQALEQAAAFISAKKNVASAKGMMRMAYKAPVLTSADTLQAYYYVFNVGDNGGFVVVSGDDRTEQILGYTDSGSYDPNNVPDNMRWWLGEYADQIKQLGEHSDTAVAAAKSNVALRTAVATKTSIAPLLTTTWDQGSPYWNLCPTFSGTTCVTGCVATAMAQIMYYHKWPQAATASLLAYTTKTKKLSIAALPAITFAWDKMRESYSGSEADENKTAVAQLMQYCGSSVNMDYNTSANGGSSAYSSNVPSALKTYFGYDADTKYVSRSSYSIADWDALIYSEIKNNRPVLYSGTSTSGGHAFVCDGYDEDNFYHINWGWGGMSNGYFRLSVLNSGSLGIGGGSSEDGFSMSQGAVIGIQAEDGVTTPEKVCMTTTSCYLTNGVSGTQTVTRTSSINNFSVGVTFNAYNYMSSTYKFSLGFGLYQNDELKSETNFGSVSLGQYYGYTDFARTFSFGAGLADGTYQIRPISKESSSGTWLADFGADKYYIQAVISGNSMTLTDVKPTVSLTVKSLEFTGTCIAGSTQELKMTIINNGSEYNGNFYVYANGTRVTYNGVALEAGKTSVVYFHYTPNTAGTYTMTVKAGSKEDTATDLGFSSSQVITAASSTTPSLNGSVVVSNTSNSKIYGNTFKCTVTVTNTGSATYSGEITALIFDADNENAYVGQSSQTIGLLTGKSVDLDYEFDNLTYGKTYLLNVIYTISSSYDYFSIYNEYTMSRAITSWDKSGTATYSDASSTSYTVPSTAVAVDLQGTSVTGVTLSSGVSPNCLYFFDSGDATPSALSGKNVVKGGTAETITLTDGKDFYSPYDFNAATISYSRTFTSGADGSGGNWSTIVLPFKPASVKNATDNVALDWFHSSSESGKMLWIEDFTQEDADAYKVYFDYAGTELLANHPYIIAVAGDHWGSKWSLVGKEIKFSASNADVLATPKALVEGVYYNFIGGTVSASKAASSVYYLNSTGDNFALNNAAAMTVEPFRAYFIHRTSQYDDPLQAKALSICLVGDDDATGVAQPTVAADGNVDVYNISGVKVRSGVSSSQSLDGLPKGIYIINGKKVVK